VVAEPLVGRTGASGARVLDGSISSPRHEAPVAHVRPFIQHPPPRDAGHENQPVEHMYCDDEDVVGSEVEVDDDVKEVGTTTTAVEVSIVVDDEGVGVDDVEG
jgi:hypothetical protein